MPLDYLLTRLESTLEKNIALYTAMESALHEESAALTAHDLLFLKKVITVKSQIAAQIAALESDRITTVKKLAAAFNLPLDGFNLTTLMEKIAPTRREKLRTLQKSLRERVIRSEELNEFNRGVIEKLMNINHEAASYLQELQQPEQSYNATGIAPPRLKSGRVISRTL